MTEAEAEMENEERSMMTSELDKLALQTAAIYIEIAKIEKEAAEEKAKIEKEAAEEKAKSEARIRKIKKEAAEEKAKSEAQLRKIKKEAAEEKAKFEARMRKIEKEAAEEKAKIAEEAATEKANSEAREAKAEEEAARTTNLGQKDQDLLGLKFMASMLVKATNWFNTNQQWADIKLKTS